MIDSMMMKASAKPTSGEAIIGMTTFSVIVCHSTVTPPARPAPTRPPISACVDDDGRPKYQVIRFQVIAPSRPARMMTRPWFSETPSMVSTLWTVFATSCPSSAPTKFMTAAMISATRGVSARVEIEVAMALAASWKPLV